MTPGKTFERFRQTELRTNEVVAIKQVCAEMGLPTGFRPAAQGCAGRAAAKRRWTARATLGQRDSHFLNRNEVATNSIPPASAQGKPQPRWGWPNLPIVPPG